ncbi:isoamyl alcohol oxidase [Aspergillus affinis]|uniref:isoamyl alcohol oxidase n=1 Tax=Aspergillus affinis TaxID=1070780 RepID=UPI0022FF2112|nr:isoamyl alcohol oxidase [Aspergillus affinis]KAI9044339.1 isoamyl alcohol oxidase [Aspergillus affinis]
MLKLVLAPFTYNEEECAYVQAQWSNSTFQSLQPIGYVYPTDDPCLPVELSAGEKPGTCTFGPAPVYTINATEVDELVEGMKFARENNIRFAVRNTGHDLLVKSEGYGALQVTSFNQGIALFLQYDEIFGSGSGLIWLGMRFQELQTLGEPVNWWKVLGGLLGVGLVGGPGAAFTVGWGVREELIAQIA